MVGILGIKRCRDLFYIMAGNGCSSFEVTREKDKRRFLTSDVFKSNRLTALETGWQVTVFFSVLWRLYFLFHRPKTLHICVPKDASRIKEEAE
jgi:hypothetical protein